MTRVQVDCFLSAAKNGSFAGAAKELYLSVQVVSQHIQNLEKEFSTKLFHRSRDGVSLTEDGHAFHDFSIKWIGLYSRTMRSIRDVYDNMAVDFRIGLSEYVDPIGLIGSGISSFCQEHKATNVSGTYLGSRNVTEELAAGRIDVGVITDTQVVPSADLEMAPFAKEDLHLYISCCPELESALSLDDPRLVRVCREIPHINAPYGPWNDNEWEEITRRMNAFLGLPFRTHISMPNFCSVIACAGRTPCAIVCDAKFGYFRGWEDLRAFPLDVNANLCCVWNKRNENPLIPLFVKHLKEHYGEQSA